MRDAIANAAVGDEQKREDPTVNELERRGAEFLGQEEAVFLPTATMANQIALQILGRPGDPGWTGRDNRPLSAAGAESAREQNRTAPVQTSKR